MQVDIAILLWLLWLIFWVGSAGWAKSTRWQESSRSRAGRFAATVAALWLLCLPQWLPGMLVEPIVAYSSGLAWSGTAILAAGLGLSVWARLHLGRNWSGAAAIKEAHELVRTGPYGRVRHPIYAGIILALVGMTITLDQWRALMALALIVLSSIQQLRREEDAMAATFPEYAGYREVSAALFPFIY